MINFKLYIRTFDNRKHDLYDDLITIGKCTSIVWMGEHVKPEEFQQMIATHD